MILEHAIYGALLYFGKMNSSEIQKKLQLRGMNVEMRDIDGAIRNLLLHKKIRKADYDKTIYVGVVE